MSSTSSSSSLRCVADALGLGFLADDEPAMDPELLRNIYRHARDEDGQRELFEGDLTFAKGWVNLNSPRATELLSAFVPLDDANDLKQARRIAKANLEAQPWNDIVGIESPPIICKVKIHGSKWGLRFQSGIGAMKGREKVNEDLPAIPPATLDSPAAACRSEENLDCGEDIQNKLNPAEDALRKAGMLP